MNETDAECVIRKKSIEDKSKASVLRSRGCEGLNEAANNVINKWRLQLVTMFTKSVDKIIQIQK